MKRSRGCGPSKLLLFATSWWLRGNVPAEPRRLALTPSFVGAALALVTGWLGGELVDRLSVGVDQDANVNAPSSLRTRHVRA